MFFRCSSLLFVSVAVWCFFLRDAQAKPLVLAHYMPWFEYPANAYHWPPQGGTYYLPLIGIYSSQNETVLEWQLALMSAVNIDGVIVDWYGTSSKNDFPFIKQSTDLLWSKIQSDNPDFSDMILAICYDMNQYQSEPTQTELQQSMQYLADHYFTTAQYLHVSNDPVMLLWPAMHSGNWNQQFMNNAEWNALKAGVNTQNLQIFVEFENPAWVGTYDGDGFGAFEWVYPQRKSADESTQITQVQSDFNYYYTAAQLKQQPFYMGSIFRGFNDHYVSGGTGTTNPYNGIGFIDADYGYLNITYAANVNPAVIQIPTWNDYSEGTMIEPAIPTPGCIKGCATDTDPYNNLLNIYGLVGDGTMNRQQKEQQLRAITHKYFPTLTLQPTQ